MRRNRGFTLIELMVALSVLAVVAVTANGRTIDTLRQLQRLEERSFATWVAENELAELRLAQRQAREPIATGNETRRRFMAGREWRVERAVIGTEHPWMRRVEIDVIAVDDDGREGQAHRLVGFLGAR